MYFSQYLMVLSLSLAVPLLLSFWPPLKFYSHWRGLLASLIVVMAVFCLGWDVLAAWRGHWSFGAQGVMGIYILKLPLEEFLFFPVIVFCCLFTWEVVLFFKRLLSL